MRNLPAPRAALIATVLVLVMAMPAAAQSPAETRCRDAIAKNVARYVKTALKLVEKCHARRASGSLPINANCGDLGVIDSKGKLGRLGVKFRVFVGGAKNKCLASNGLLPQYPSCPFPAATADDGGTTTGTDNFTEVADCLIALSNKLIPIRAAQALGNPSAPLSSGLQNCQRAIGKSLTSLVTTIIKERRGCQRSIDRQGVGVGYECAGTDPKGRIGKSQVQLNAAISTSCGLPQAELAELNACGDTTFDLRQCVDQDVADPLGSTLIRNAYLFPGGTGGTTTTMVGGITTTTLSTCGGSFPACSGSCPSGSFCNNTGLTCECESASGACAQATVIRNIKSRLGDFPTIRQTQLSTGYSGLAHQVDIPGNEGSTDAVDLVCDANCENCQVSLNTLFGDPRSYCRCSNNPRISCDTINGSDPACTGLGASCRCFFGAPLSISAGGTPVCVLNTIVADYGGTANLRAGEWFDTAQLSSLVHLGLTQTAPCPTCGGDITPNDGIRDGTCQGALASGACDTNAVHPTFGPMSLDCPPNSLTNVSGGGLQIRLQFSTGQRQLSYNLPCDDPGTFGNCPCRVCSGDANVGCNSDADCAALGAGACTAGGGSGVRPNQCSDLVCNAQGRCPAGPVDMFCDGTTQPDGSGFVTCQNNAGCATSGGGGTCSIQANRRCFTNPIVTEGSPSLVAPVRAAAFCIPPTTSAAVNASGGLPGAGTFDLDFRPDFRCRSDINEPYEFPSGQNCVTSSTTTTLIGLPCVASLAPACGGSCPIGQDCEPLPPLNTTCQCVAAATTTTLPTPCGDAFPTCGQGACPPGESCNIDLLNLTCNCTAGTECADTLFPICGGTCPGGQTCQGDVLGLACQCGP